jgi:hypothetical protein
LLRLSAGLAALPAPRHRAGIGDARIRSKLE